MQQNELEQDYIKFLQALSKVKTLGKQRKLKKSDLKAFIASSKDFMYKAVKSTPQARNNINLKKAQQIYRILEQACNA